MEPKTEKFWFYIKDQQQLGPVGAFELQKLFQQGVLSRNTFIWSAGLNGWQQAKAVALFSECMEGHSPCNPSAKKENLAAQLELATYPRGRPLIRFIARMFDLSLFTLFFIASIAVFSPGLIVHTSKITLFMVNLLLWLFIEPIILCIFGNTAGKAIMNTQIKSQYGEAIQFPTAFKRSFFVIIAGMGFGVPVLNFICYLFSLVDLQKNGMSAWDKKSGTIVLYGKVPFPRIFFASLFPVILFISGIVL